MHSLKAMMGIAGATMFALATWTAAAEPGDTVALPAPRMEGGKPLMQALKERQTSRAFSPKALPAQVLSDLLWAAFGINRPDSGKRTAPSTRNWQEIDIYAVTADGAYLYDAKANSLRLAVTGDLRKLTGSQDFVSTAPLNLVFVADLAKMKGSAADQTLYSAADVGFISQNVYLVDRAALAKALNLPESQQVILAQTVGYPAEAN